MPGPELIVPRLYQVEEFGAVGNVYGGAAQLVVERGVVQQIEILEHQQARCLVIGVKRDEGAQVV